VRASRRPMSLGMDPTRKAEDRLSPTTRPWLSHFTRAQLLAAPVQGCVLAFQVLNSVWISVYTSRFLLASADAIKALLTSSRASWSGDSAEASGVYPGIARATTSSSARGCMGSLSLWWCTRCGILRGSVEVAESVEVGVGLGEGLDCCRVREEALARLMAAASLLRCLSLPCCFPFLLSSLLCCLSFLLSFFSAVFLSCCLFLLSFFPAALRWRPPFRLHPTPFSFPFLLFLSSPLFLPFFVFLSLSQRARPELTPAGGCRTLLWAALRRGSGLLALLRGAPLHCLV